LIGRGKILSFLVFGSLLSPSVRLFYLVCSCRHPEVFVSAPGECRALAFPCAAKALWSFSVGTRVACHSFSLLFGLLARAKECCP
jgi:hypothetical protein